MTVFSITLLLQINILDSLNSLIFNLPPLSDNIKFKTSEISKYSILEDKEPPIIERIKFNRDQMKFRIYDELSGIKSYEGRINNNWILFEYDNKNDIIISKKKNSIQSFQGKFVLEVIDNANNIRILNLNL